MLILISLFIAFGFAYLLHDVIKKKPSLFYVGALLITLVTIGLDLLYIVYPYNLPNPLYNTLLLSRRGILAGALFILVMFTGALNNKWTVTKRLMKNRGELAIMATILMTAHGSVYFMSLMRYVKTMIQYNEFPVAYLAIYAVGILASLIMIPLCITSFKKVKKKMGNQKWRRVQKWSYAFYGLFYLHMAVIYLQKSKIELNFIIYTILFGVYTVMRIHKAVSKKKKITKK